MFLIIQKEKFDKDFIVKVSYLEVYNENLRDLLTTDE